MALMIRTCIDLDTGEVMSEQVIGEVDDRDAAQRMCRALTGQSIHVLAGKLADQNSPEYAALLAIHERHAKNNIA